MKKDCELIKRQKKNNLKILKNSVIVLIVIAVCIYIICINKEMFLLPFKNVNGIIDNNIIWSAIGALGGILAFVGVIITIIVTEKSRKKQNEEDYRKEKLLAEQLEFKHVVKSQLDLLDPSIILTKSSMANNENYAQLQQNVSEYLAQIKIIELNICWYYDKTIMGNYPMLNKFIVSLRTYIDNVNKILIEYNQVLFNFPKIQIFRLYEQMETTGLMNESRKEEFKEFKKVNQNIEILNQELIIKTNSVINEINRMNNISLANLHEQAKDVVEERNNIIQDKIRN